MGILHVRGGSAIPYYLNKPEKTAESIRDGWVRTGDVYRRDEDGFFWFEGRSDDLFKCSGMWVSPGEVEDAVATHPAVLEAAVIAEADETGATIPAAYVMLRPGNSANEKSGAARSWRRRRNTCRASSSPSASTSWTSCRARRPARCSASSCASSPRT